MAKQTSVRKRAGRPPGRRNPDYEGSRAALVEAVRQRLLHDPAGERNPSFRQLADAAQVSTATLRHYFASRESLVAEVLADAHRQGLPFLHLVAAGPLPPTLRESVSWFLEFLTTGLDRGVAQIHAASLAEGLGESVIGPAYVNHLLEPTLQALEARLERHMARGDMGRTDARHAALMLVSPMLLARLHQGPLGGSRCRPLDEGALRADLLEAFLAVHATKPGG